MKKVLTVLILAVLMVFCLASCKQASTIVENPNQFFGNAAHNTHASRFDFFWRSLNSHYVFWDIDETDWDAVYDAYMPKFEALDKTISEASAEDKAEVIETAFNTAVQYYTDATKTLVDHHMAIIIFDPYREKKGSSYISPSSSEIKTRSYYHAGVTKDENGLINWSANTDIACYFDESGIGSATVDGYKTATNLANADEIAVTYYEKYDPATGTGEAVTDNVVNSLCVAYDITIDKKNSDGSDMHVVYLAMSDYMVTSWLPAYLNSPDSCPADPAEAFNWKAGKTLVAFFTTVKKYFDSGELAGVLLDNRVNTGGAAADTKFMIGLYTSQPVTIQYSKVKEGFGKTDYCSEFPWTVYPIKSTDYCPGLPEFSCDLVSANIPYVVLCSIGSVSMGEITTSGISALNNGYTIGERTYGGTGALFREPEKLVLTYGGTFGSEKEGPFFCYTSEHNPKCYTRDGFKSLEGIGYTPDKVIEYKQTGDSVAEGVRTMYKSQVKEAFSYISKY